MADRCLLATNNSPEKVINPPRLQVVYHINPHDNHPMVKKYQSVTSTISKCPLPCCIECYMGMDQYLLIPFLGGWTSIYQLFWCSPGVQGFDTLPHGGFHKWDTQLSEWFRVENPKMDDDWHYPHDFWTPRPHLPVFLELLVHVLGPRHRPFFMGP